MPPNTEIVIGLLLGVRTNNIACARDIVHGYVIEFRKNENAVDRDSCFSALIVCICSLPHMEHIGYSLLGEVMVFPKMSYPLIIFHFTHLSIKNYMYHKKI